MIIHTQLLGNFSLKCRLGLIHNALPVTEVSVRFLKPSLLQHIFQLPNPSSFSVYHPKAVLHVITKFTGVTLKHTIQLLPTSPLM